MFLIYDLLKLQLWYQMRQKICEKIKLLHLLPVLLLPSKEMRQSQECLSAINHPCVPAAQCTSGGDTTYHYRKTVCVSVAMVCCQALLTGRNGSIEESKGGEKRSINMRVIDSAMTILLAVIGYF